MKQAMRMTIAAAAVASSALVVAACSNAASETTEAASSTTSAATSTTTAAASSTRSGDIGKPSPRGNYVGSVGTPVAAGNQQSGSKPSITWTITDIAVDPPCELSIAKPATNGHFVVATIDAETAEGFDEDVTLPGGFHPSNNWSIVGPDGYVQPRATSDASIYCIDAEWPQELAPGSKYRFRVVFDSKSSSGILTYKAPNWNGGWEWQFGGA